MPIRQIPDTDLQYYLVNYDENGRERRESDGAPLSDEVKRAVASGAVTDVFLMSHGWQGDVPAAVDQYDRWVAEMGRSSDIAVAMQRPGGFRPLIVGLHWPSLPWGDENIPARGTPGMLDAGDDEAVDLFAARIADTPDAREALHDIFTAVEESEDAGDVDTLPPAMHDAYNVLFEESRLGAADVAGPPGSDQDAWDAEAIFQTARTARDPAQPGLLDWKDKLRDALLSPLRQLSFWKMKARARAFGESGAHTLLADLEKAAPAARFHLMGHSFGCIVVSAAVAGPQGSTLPRPVSSLFLVQGALSLWSYCDDIPYARGTAGYFHRIIADGLVDGPIVTTRSSFDGAVGTYYPLGAKAHGELVLADDELPKYGGVGTFGAQGLGDRAEDLPLGDRHYDYHFAPRQVYNLEASKVIKEGDPPSGAHSDIVHPELAHVQMSAALSGTEAHAVG